MKPIRMRLHHAGRVPAGAAATLMLAGALAATALAAAPVPGGLYMNPRNLDAITVAKAGTSGHFTVTPHRCNDGLSIPGRGAATITPAGALTYNGYGDGSDEVNGKLRAFKIKLVITGTFTTPTTLKWRTTITMPRQGTTFGYCKETVSSTLRFYRVALK